MPDEPKPKPAGVKAGQLIEKYKRIAREARKGLKDVTAERDALQARPSTADLESKVAAYAKADKERTYRAAFDAECEAAGIKGRKQLDAAWRLAEIDQSGDKPDAAKIKSTVETFAAEHDYLKAPAGSTEVKGDDKTPLTPGLGGDRGGSNKLVGKTTISRSKFADAAWVHQNQAMVGDLASRDAIAWVD